MTEMAEYLIASTTPKQYLSSWGVDVTRIVENFVGGTMMSGTHVCRFGMRRKLAQSGNGKKR
jgi:hypothetical protein